MGTDRLNALESLQKLAVESQHRHFDDNYVTTPEAAREQLQYEDTVDILVQQLSEAEKQYENTLLKVCH
jgi:hypothetical protein